MIYKNDTVRRQDRILDQESAIKLLISGEYGILSVIDEDNPYAIPANYCWDGNDALYIHCAPEGRKLRCIEKNNKASFCIVGRTNVLPSQFSTEYESIVLTCTASYKLSKEERQKALELIVEKYAPAHIEKGMKYIEKSFGRTEIIKLEVVEFSGKSKKIR